MAPKMRFVNWTTDRRADLHTATLLTPTQYETAVTEILTGLLGAPHSRGVIEEWAERFAPSLFWMHFEHGDQWDAAGNLTPEGVEDAAEAIADWLTVGYRIAQGSLLGEVSGDFRHRNHGAFTTWTAAAYRYEDGEDSSEGTSNLAGFVHITGCDPGLHALAPWIIASNEGTPYENTAAPQAVGLVTSHAESILRHAATTHPDPAVRAEIIADPFMRFTADELAAFAANTDDAVAAAASTRIITIASS